MTYPTLNQMETTDDWAFQREAPPFAAPIQLALSAIAGIVIICGVTLMTRTAYDVGPDQSYTAAWCLTSIGFHVLTGVVAAENYRRMRSLGRGKARMQKAQIKLRDGQRDLTVGQAELRKGQEVLEGLMLELRDRIADGTVRVDAGAQATELAKAEILERLREVGDRVNNGVNAVELAYMAAGGTAVDEFTPRRVARD